MVRSLIRVQTGQMVRTGRRAAALQALLIKAGLHTAPIPPPPRLAQLPGEARTAVDAVYSALGGSIPVARFRPGSWDLAFADGLVVELDEELHFNRYRARTLEGRWAAELPWQEDYLDYASRYEQKCLAAGGWGRRWSTRPCETMFGLPGPPGALDGAGSPRWKQRALYDAIKDITATHSTVLRLARLSVWDSVNGTLLGDALNAKALIDPVHVAAVLARRTTKSA